MSLDTLSLPPVREDETSYNTKWTILAHVRQIAKTLYGRELGDESFIDSTPIELGTVPQFGVEYMGTRERTGFEKPVGLYVVSYRGTREAVEVKSEYGVDSNNRQIMFLHDSIKLNFEERTSGPGIELLDFSNKNNVPRLIGVLFNMNLVESSFPFVENTGARANGFDLIYEVFER